MHRTTGAGHVNNMFVSEDPATNRPPTEVTADILNALQEEIANAIEVHGVPLDPSSNAQLSALLVAKAPLASPPFSGEPTVPTPVQFDSSRQIANTEFVKRALGNCSGYYYLSASTHLLESRLGGFINLAGNTPGQVYTLPSVGDVQAGDGYWLCSISRQPLTIKGEGANSIISARSVGNTFTFHPGESCYIACNAGANWNVGGLSQAIGVGQTHRDVTLSRVINTTYTNGSFSPLPVSVMLTNSIQAHVAITITNPYTGVATDILGSGSYSTYDQACFITATVPPFHLYRVGVNTGTPVLISWTELS